MAVHTNGSYRTEMRALVGQGSGLHCSQRQGHRCQGCPASAIQYPGEQLVCVGTSATLGGPDSCQAMLDYAGLIFASHFEPGSLIEEERLSPEAFFRDH